MSWLSIFKNKPGRADAAPTSPPAGDAVQQARVRARRRLIGAVVLVAIGVIGFPLLFESQPRPLPIDIPIEIPRKDQAPPLAMPPARPSAQASAAAAVPEPVLEAAARPAIITETPDDAGREVAPASAPRASAPAAGPAPVRAPVAPTPAPEAARAQALLDGKPAGSARFVVQAGAFADAGTASQTRTKLEGLGLKTYTQVTETPAGKRTRVRLGPFATRAEAEQALAKARAAGVSAVVLTL